MQAFGVEWHRVGLGRFRLGGDDQALGELQGLVESRRAGQDKRGRVEHDAVADTRGVGVGDETMIGSIVCDGGSEIEAYASIVVPFLADGIMSDKKNAAWCHWVRDKVVRLTMEAMIGGDGHVVGPSMEHIQRPFSLGQQMMPLIDGEIGMSTHQDREKVPAKCLDGTFGLVSSLLGRWNVLDFDML